jgi:hypothetical protein
MTGGEALELSPVASRAYPSEFATLYRGGHDQCCLALFVHAAEPTGVKKRLTPLPVTDAVGLAYLHRHAAARASVSTRTLRKYLI